MLQVPLYTGETWFLFLLYGTIVSVVLGSVAFIFYYNKRKISKVSSEVEKLSSRVDDIEGPWPESDEIKDRVIHMEDYLHHFSRGVEKEFSVLKEHVLSEGEKGLKTLRKDLMSKLEDGLVRNEMKISRLGATLTEVKKGLDSQSKDIGRSKRKTGDQLREIIRLYLFMMLEELRGLKDDNLISTKLRNIRTFRNFAKKQKWWDKKMQDDLLESMREMEKGAGSFSPLYSMFLDEMRKAK